MATRRASKAIGLRALSRNSLSSSWSVASSFMRGRRIGVWVTSYRLNYGVFTLFLRYQSPSAVTIMR